MTATLKNLRVDHLTEPLAVPTARPVFSWEIESSARNVVQASYSVTVTVASGRRAGEELWRSGVVSTHRSGGVRYAGAGLPAESEFQWVVEVQLAGGETVSQTGRFESGPSSSSWSAASWIGRARPLATPVDRHPAPYLRNAFAIDGAVRRARIYATAGGLFDLWCNDRRVSEGDLAPGWTDYRYRIPFHSFDLTPHLVQGQNVIGAILGEGWYSGYVGPFGKRGVWGPQPVLRCVGIIEYEDGRTQVFTSDPGWECATGPILLAELLHGFRYDNRLVMPGWSASIGGWDDVVQLAGPAGELVPARIPAAGPFREVRPIDIQVTPSGSQLVDFGQNLAGRVRVELEGASGSIVRFRHAELLDEQGALYTDNLRMAAAVDEVILSGAGRETFEPIFTYHGFRYVEVDGAIGPISSDDIVAVAISSLRGTTLDFRTDSELLNQVQKNLEWTMLSNFIEVPTDCPNRDERLGWAGDAQMFAPVAMYNGDTEAFFAKWLEDIADAQKQNGAFADIAPGGLVDFAEEGAAGYADAGVLLPWDVYRHWGSDTELASYYAGAKAWLRYIGAANPDYIWRNQRNADYGDWLSTEPSNKLLTATAYWARAAQITAKYAEVLGLNEERDAYQALARMIVAAFTKEFRRPDGSFGGTSQTEWTLALTFELLSPDQVDTARAELIADVERRGHITTGFLGTRFVYGALAAAGRPDLAVRTLLRTERPSLGYQIARGLTTIGEHWSAWDEDGTILDPAMNSLNHFALASVFEWVYASIGGIAPIDPGFDTVKVAPVTDGTIGESLLSFDSPHGRVTCHWLREDDGLRMFLTVPANCSAIVDLPGGVVTESDVALEVGDGVRSIEHAAGTTRITVGSGSYEFFASEERP